MHRKASGPQKRFVEFPNTQSDPQSQGDVKGNNLKRCLLFEENEISKKYELFRRKNGFCF